MEWKSIILLGTNLGDKAQNLSNAIHALGEIGTVLTTSRIYSSAPWGYQSESQYWNQAVEVRFDCDPEAFMGLLLESERALGRMRTLDGYQDRVMDLDILAIADYMSDTEVLAVPHPRLIQRRFAMEPMLELWPHWVHPKTGLSLVEHRDAVPVDASLRIVNFSDDGNPMNIE